MTVLSLYLIGVWHPVCCLLVVQVSGLVVCFVIIEGLIVISRLGFVVVNIDFI